MQDHRRAPEHLHLNAAGDDIVIPPMMFKFCLADAAAQRKDKKVKTTHWGPDFTKLVAVFDEAPLGIKPDDVRYETFSMSSTGDRGRGKRVPRRYPMIDEWEARVKVYLVSDEIPERIFEETCKTAGLAIGIGRFRPQNGGTNGRFKVIGFDWQDEEI
jgi:hypothetical protein